MSNKKRVIILAHTIRFPNGMGGGARIANYACGLFSLGVPVTVLCLKAYEPVIGPIINPNAQGLHNGAFYMYTCGTSILAEKGWHRWVQNIKGLIGVVRYLLPLVKHKQIKVIHYYGVGYSSLYTFFGWLLSRWAKVPYIGEMTEEPFIYSRKSFVNRFTQYLFWHLIAKLLDGVIVISQHLNKTFTQAVRKNVRVDLIPVLVNLSRFNNEDSEGNCNVTYCGNLENKEEIDALLEVWGKVANIFSNYRLRVIGDGSPSRMQYIYERVRMLNIQERVEFLGLIAHEDLPATLQNSFALVLPRPSGLYSTAGFPNKLGEYLATGRPVLCTSVGDIPLYLRDNESAFLVEPGNIDAFTNRLIYILENPTMAAEVGFRGRQISENYFELAKNSQRLVDIYVSLERYSRKYS